MFVMTVAYRKEINLDYYLTRHAPAAVELFKQFGLIRADVKQFTATADGREPAYKVMTTATFPSREAYEALMKHPAAAELVADVANFAQETPEFLLGEVLFDQAN